VRRLIALLAVTATAAAGAVVAPAAVDAADDPVTITLVTHDSFAASKSVLAAFTKQSGVKVKILRAGDAGSALNQVILTKDDPLGDVFFGVDNTFLSRALDAAVFQPYESPALASVPVEYQLDATHHLTPVDRGDVCINVDKKWFAREGVPVPTTLADLVAPEYSGTLVVENAATSSPGLAFLLATIARYGEDGWQDYWEQLRDNDVLVVDDWTNAFEGQFSQGGGDGTYPLVVSYASSPPVAVYFSKPTPKTSPIGTMLDSCFQQVEFAGVLAGTEHRREARAFVDFLLSKRFQEDIPLQMFVFPVRDDAALPPVFQKFAEVPPSPLSLPPAEIGANREQWIDAWTDTVLR
jgi:thiamine transport system substrate-binding protein